MAIDNRYEFLFTFSAATATPMEIQIWAMRPGWTLRTCMAILRM